MTTSQFWWIPIASAALSAATTVFVANWIFQKNQSSLVENEWKKEQYKLADELFSIRYILNISYLPSAAEITQLNKALNRIPLVFRGDNEIADKYNNFLRSTTDGSPSKNTDFVDLLKCICKTPGFADGLDSRYISNALSYPQRT
jgi:hypothetical protein